MKCRLKKVIVGVAVAAAVCAGSLGTATASIGAGVVSAGSEVGALKNYDCGWGIKTKYHSCALAYSLVFQWTSVGKEYRDSLHQVFSPNSGSLYDFKCSGVKNVTCKSNKGAVSFKRSQLSAKRYCDEYRDVVVYAWLKGSCDFAMATVAEYESKPYYDNSRISVVDPISGRTYAMECFGVHDADAVMCINGKRAAILYR